MHRKMSSLWEGADYEHAEDAYSTISNLNKTRLCKPGKDHKENHYTKQSNVANNSANRQSQSPG